MGKVTQLPLPTFPEGTRFFDVEGIPVVRKPDRSVVAFDPAPRLFPGDAVLRNGTLVSEAEFRDAVAARRAVRGRPWRGGWIQEWPEWRPPKA